MPSELARWRIDHWTKPDRTVLGGLPNMEGDDKGKLDEQDGEARRAEK